MMLSVLLATIRFVGMVGAGADRAITEAGQIQRLQR